MTNAPRTIKSTQEYVHTFSFEVGEGEFVHDMSAHAASEEEARAAVQKRLRDAGLDRPRPIRLMSTKERIAVRTRMAVAS